ncbi:hypothetical protein BC936DRAFT_146162 [Jimgerdemannia flammicorona]|uniref:Uncharacterized protein n=1 Tax=Jimgerdemannia flammicorona TaxID=994334 RepID=A0A433D866_9FUNG|nr:hypothetical protein BC936DRAFT_146162 [Jimgerdemannia flammicorona]
MDILMDRATEAAAHDLAEVRKLIEGMNTLVHSPQSSQQQVQTQVQTEVVNQTPGQSPAEVAAEQQAKLEGAGNGVDAATAAAAR